MPSTHELDQIPAPVKLCGVVSEDYPELVCEYPAGHALITDEAEDIFEVEHGAPSKGGWFSNPGPSAPVLSVEERIAAAKREALESVFELLTTGEWAEPPAAEDHRLQLASWLKYRIDLFDRGIWSAIPGGEEVDIARAEQD